MLMGVSCARAQDQLKIAVTDSATGKPIQEVTVKINGAVVGFSDTAGKLVMTSAPGTYTMQCSATGYAAMELKVTLPAAGWVLIKMAPSATDLEEVTLVASTRNNQAMEDNPLKVEVLGKEELAEEANIRPANVASLISDVSGVQIQQSSAVSGNSNVRIQGLQGRYTQVLRDGMPLYEGYSGGFGILTIPPLDLKQIELIKGSASTLYGGGAIGGLINLISRIPGFDQEAEAVVNYTSLSEVDADAYLAKRYKKVGYTFFAGYTHQDAKDVNGDGLSDVPDISSLVVHPKLFFYPSDKTIISIGGTGTFDDRKGGDIHVLQDGADSVHKYYERNNSQRFTGEYMIEHFLPQDGKLVFKGTASQFGLTTTTNTYAMDGKDLTWYDEASLSMKVHSNGFFVGGVNMFGDNYFTTQPAGAYISSFNNFTVGAFAQYSLTLNERTHLEAGIRVDATDKYGSFFLPRIAALHHINEHFGVRAGFGMGYKLPDPLEQQDIDYDPLTIVPPGGNVQAELSYGYNLEGNYKKEWDKEHTLFINHAFFLTTVSNPIQFVTDSLLDRVELVNEKKPVTTMGFDTYVKGVVKKWELYAGYTYTDARMHYAVSDQYVPLTPRNRLAFVVVKEIEEKWRFGLEGSYIGTQYRYDGTPTPSYMMMALMIMRNIGSHVTLVLNCENLLDYRMTKEESVYTGSIQDPMFKPLWAPVDGRVVNFSIKWKLAGKK